MGENQFAALPVAFYGVVLLLAAIAYFALTRTLILYHGQNSTLANAIGRDIKGKLSVLIYAVAIPLAFAIPWLSCALYVLVAVMWLVPDRRIEKTVKLHVLMQQKTANNPTPPERSQVIGKKQSIYIR
jgi:uncharacterized membrane protein